MTLAAKIKCKDQLWSTISTKVQRLPQGPAFGAAVNAQHGGFLSSQWILITFPKRHGRGFLFFFFL